MTPPLIPDNSEPEQPSARDANKPPAPEPAPGPSSPPPPGGETAGTPEGTARQEVFLKLPCPRCRGRMLLDTSISDKKLQGVRCIGCSASWPNYPAMVGEARARRAAKGAAPGVSSGASPRKFGLNDLYKLVSTGRRGMRAIRNIAERTHIATRNLKQAAVEAKHFSGRESTSEIGDLLEGVFTQALLSISDVQEALKGKMPNVPPPDPEPAPPNRAKRPKSRRR